MQGVQDAGRVEQMLLEEVRMSPACPRSPLHVLVHLRKKEHILTTTYYFDTSLSPLLLFLKSVVLSSSRARSRALYGFLLH